VKSKPPVLTPQELEIMKVVWQLGSATVRDVYEEMLKHRKVAYTTVMTMMKILEGKGFLKKSAGDRAYLYKPAQPKERVVGGMVKEFLNRVFNGSAKPLLVHLVENKQVTDDELQEIRRLLEEKKS
jgi:BlaI family penicillinase repressor